MTQPSARNMSNPSYDSQRRTWDEQELVTAVREVTIAAKREPNSGFSLEIASVETRDLIRQELFQQLEGQWTEQQNSPEHGWWQLRLYNGSVIRVQSLRDEGGDE